MCFSYTVHRVVGSNGNHVIRSVTFSGQMLYVGQCFLTTEKARRLGISPGIRGKIYRFDDPVSGEAFIWGCFNPEGTPELYQKDPFRLEDLLLLETEVVIPPGTFVHPYVSQ